MGANNRLTNDLLQEKPQDWRGRVPAPPSEMLTARMTYRCGLAIYGACPAVKSLARARRKRRRHHRGLWRRGRRQYRQRIEDMAILTEHPDSEKRIPEGAAASIRRRAAEAGYDHWLCQDLRGHQGLREAVDEYFSFKKPYTPKG